MVKCDLVINIWQLYIHENTHLAICGVSAVNILETRFLLMWKVRFNSGSSPNVSLDAYLPGRLDIIIMEWQHSVMWPLLYISLYYPFPQSVSPFHTQRPVSLHCQPDVGIKNSAAVIHEDSVSHFIFVGYIHANPCRYFVDFTQLK